MVAVGIVAKGYRYRIDALGRKSRGDAPNRFGEVRIARMRHGGIAQPQEVRRKRQAQGGDRRPRFFLPQRSQSFRRKGARVRVRSRAVADHDDQGRSAQGSEPCDQTAAAKTFVVRMRGDDGYPSQRFEWFEAVFRSPGHPAFPRASTWRPTAASAASGAGWRR
jgi:hypothetical protein